MIFKVSIKREQEAILHVEAATAEEAKEVANNLVLDEDFVTCDSFTKVLFPHNQGVSQ